MKKLILCADRDDDIGEKTSWDTPIIGREDNLQAAIELGLEDPEDSDTNSIFSAISLYDDLKQKGEDVEIATICGAPSIGYTSDEALSEELDIVIEKTNPDSAVLVTDGAEDEYISPIVSSKIDLSHIRTVYVKQSESVENLYYLFVKTFREERTKRKILLPISLALLIYGALSMIPLVLNLAMEGVSAFVDLPGFGIGAIFFVIGLYIVIRTYELDRKTLKAYSRFKEATSEGAIWLPFSVVAGLMVIVSSLQGWNTVVEEEITEPIYVILTFITTVIWWWIGAVFLYKFGRLLDAYITKGKVSLSFWSLFLTLFASAFILHGSLDYIRGIVGMTEISDLPVAISLTLGLLLGVLAGLTQRRFKKSQKEKEEEKEIEDSVAET